MDPQANDLEVIGIGVASTKQIRNWRTDPSMAIAAALGSPSKPNPLQGVLGTVWIVNGLAA